MIQRPDVVAFDVIETMFSLETVRNRIIDAGLPGHLLELWFSRLVRDGIALTLSGTYQPFRDVALSALEPILKQYQIDSSTAPMILEEFARLDPQPDAEPALRMLTEADVRVFALTNGAPDITKTLLERSGVSPLVEQVISIEAVKLWKPHPRPYRYAAETAGVEPADMALVAVHSWDILGARQSGLVTGWASRLEGAFPSALGKPDVSGDSLTDVADALRNLPRE